MFSPARGPGNLGLTGQTSGPQDWTLQDRGQYLSQVQSSRR